MSHSIQQTHIDPEVVPGSSLNLLWYWSVMVLMVLKMVQVEMVPGSSLQRAAVHGTMPSTTACDSIQSTPSLLDRPVSQSTMRECFGTYCSIGHPVCPILSKSLKNIHDHSRKSVVWWIAMFLHTDWWTTTSIIGKHCPQQKKTLVCTHWYDPIRF